jgi:hypothetical protein
MVGMQLIWLLRAATGSNSSSRDSAVSTSSSSSSADARIRGWMTDFELAAMHGNNMPLQLRRRRAAYYRYLTVSVTIEAFLLNITAVIM